MISRLRVVCYLGTCASERILYLGFGGIERGRNECAVCKSAAGAQLGIGDNAEGCLQLRSGLLEVLGVPASVLSAPPLRHLLYAQHYSLVLSQAMTQAILDPPK